MSAADASAFDLSARAKLRLSGSDGLRYLNGQISNDLRKATEIETIYACVLSAKGKINADVFISADGEAYLIDCDAELREALAARLERYIIADDVVLQDVTEEFALFHIIETEAPGSGSTAGKVRRADRFGAPGWDLWIPAGERDARLQDLKTSLSTWDEAGAETLRIERGIPRWGRELTEEIIPTEANLEARAIDYAKGCYIGQEVISRIKMSGQTNKRLCGFVVESEKLVGAGTRLLSEEEKDVGWITSATFSERLGRQIALGFLKRGFQEPGLQFSTRHLESVAPSVVVRVTALPFVE